MTYMAKKTISVAGGANKAQALLAVLKRHSREALVIDEAAALKILEIEDRGKEKWQ